VDWLLQELLDHLLLLHLGLEVTSFQWGLGAVELDGLGLVLHWLAFLAGVLVAGDTWTDGEASLALTFDDLVLQNGATLGRLAGQLLAESRWVGILVLLVFFLRSLVDFIILLFRVLAVVEVLATEFLLLFFGILGVEVFLVVPHLLVVADLLLLGVDG